MSKPLTKEEREALLSCGDPVLRKAVQRLLADLERAERDLLAAREQGQRNNTERLAHLDRADKAERERDEARDYAAQIATGVAHYPHSEGEPCIRCERDEARAMLEAANDKLAEIGRRWDDLQRERDEARAKLARIVELLLLIEEGAGPYSRDPLTHASNTIDEMKEHARVALSIAKGEK